MQGDKSLIHLFLRAPAQGQPAAVVKHQFRLQDSADMPCVHQVRTVTAQKFGLAGKETFQLPYGGMQCVFIVCRVQDAPVGPGLQVPDSGGRKREGAVLGLKQEPLFLPEVFLFQPVQQRKKLSTCAVGI